MKSCNKEMVSKNWLEYFQFGKKFEKLKKRVFIIKLKIKQLFLSNLD